MTARRLLAIVVVVLAVSIVVALAVQSWGVIEPEAIRVTGSRNEASGWYGFWSGFAACVLGLSIFGTLGTHVRARNCHHTWCPWIGHHRTQEGYLLCKKHVAMPRATLRLHEIHEDHR